MAEVGEADVKLILDTTGASKGLQEFEGKAQKAAKIAGDGFTVLKGVAANLVTQGINVAANGVANLGRSFVNIGKTALSSYADYEQLVGGVDTLFKDASDAVQSNAKAAFRTAGLSANEYMETVTSFSASLLQGLGGDTGRAAEISDMAIKDMADNVNKMGTDMSLVQYAYQGFAKDNYTMLDNLKLGYGGSATEMARLINDSGVLNGEMEVTANNVRDVPFDKMIEAIHKVQENMGITGTTAREASDTISGSVSMAQAAWSNLVTGIADDNANWQQLVDDLIQSILTAAKNILPRIKTILQGMAKLVSSFVHDIMPSLLADVVPMVLELLPAAIDVVQTIFTTLATLIPNYLPQIIDGLMLIVDLIIDNLPTIIDVGLKIVIALAQGITDALPILLDKLPGLIEQITSVLIDNLPLIIDVAIQLMVALAGGIISVVGTIISDAVSQISEFVSGVVDSVVASIQTFCQSVADFVVGILFGIRDNASVVIDAIVGFITSIPGRVASFINAIKDAFVNAFNVARDFISNAVGAIVNFVASIPGRVSSRINAIKDAFVNAFNNARNWARDRVSDIVNFVSSIPGKVGGKINEIGDKFRDAFENIKKIVSDAIQAIVDFIASIPSRIGDIGGQIGGQISSGVSGAIDGVKGAISGLLSNIPGLATGGYVHATPGGTLAVIGEGGEDEFVIPRSQMVDILTGVANRPLPELKAENMRVDGGGVAIYNTFQINNELDAEDIGRRINNSIRLATS